MKSLVQAKQRGRFFQLADIFLASGLVPAYTMAAFIKRFARLALTGPPAGPFHAGSSDLHPTVLPIQGMTMKSMGQCLQASLQTVAESKGQLINIFTMPRRSRHTLCALTSRTNPFAERHKLVALIFQFTQYQSGPGPPQHGLFRGSCHCRTPDALADILMAKVVITDGHHGITHVV